MPTAPTSRRLPAVLAAIVFVGYVGVARGFANLYPFSTFEMYAATRTDGTSRIGARDVTGRVRSVAQYAHWSCDTPIRTEPAACFDAGGSTRAVPTLPYLDRVAFDVIATRRGDGPGRESVDVIRRIWEARAVGQGIAIRDCVLARCRARRISSNDAWVASDALPERRAAPSREVP